MSGKTLSGTSISNTSTRSGMPIGKVAGDYIHEPTTYALASPLRFSSTYQRDNNKVSEAVSRAVNKLHWSIIMNRTLDSNKKT
jgi:hypothetical protein